MTRTQLIQKINQAEAKIDKLNEERRQTRESLSAYKMILEMTDNGQLDIFDKAANKQ